jgi:hypothetical protein
MATDEILRLHYYERQFLGAADLDAQQTYLRDMRRRGNVGHNTWGILTGLMLVEEPVAGDPTAVDIFVQPGMGIDGFGREIIVMAPVKLDPLLFESFASQQHHSVWIAYDQQLVQQATGGYAQCNSTNQFGRVQETYRFVVDPKPPVHDDVTVDGKLVDPTSTDAAIPVDESVPFQEFPDDNNRPEWLLQLGWVQWDGVNSKFLPTNPASRLTDDRSYTGAVAQTVYGSEPFPATIDPVSDAPRFFIEPRFPLADPDAADFAEVKGRMQVDGRLSAIKDLWVHGHQLHLKDTAGTDGATPGVPLWMQRTAGAGGSGTDLRVHLGDSPTDDSVRLSVGPKGISTEKDVLAVRASDFVDIPTGTLTFGASTRQMINLFSDAYAMGVQPSTAYFRSGDKFCWYKGGAYSNVGADPGAGGSLQMTLDGNGSLSVAKDVNVPGTLNFGATVRQMINLWNANYGIGVQDSTLYNRSDFDFCWYLRGAHANGRNDPGGGVLAMKLDSGSNLTVSGNVNVTGSLNVSGNVTFNPATAQNLLRVADQTFALSMQGKTPRAWSFNFPAFSQIYTCYVVMQGFSIWNNDGNTAFTSLGHEANVNSIPQHVYVRITGQSATQVNGECFCSESLENNETDNTVLFTVVVMGRP